MESICWNVEILQGQEAMAEVDQERFLGNWNTSWNGRGTLEFHSCTSNNRLETDELLLEFP